MDKSPLVRLIELEHKEPLESLLVRRLKNESPEQIARTLGVTGITVRRWMKHFGIVVKETVVRDVSRVPVPSGS